MIKICVLGLGYIGLPTASILAASGLQVVGVDLKPNVIELLNGGEVHIQEPGLRTIVQAGVRSGNLVARPVPEQADVFIIAVHQRVHLVASTSADLGDSNKLAG